MSTQNREVRVRFAPSPTGPLHIGGVRTALYNYLFARQHGGKMILRIEDTDSQRFVPGAEDYINEALAWLGIGIDEGVREGGPYGPYKQSERRDIYREHVKMLLDAGKAYIAFDTPAELEAKRAEIPNFQYDASTRMSMRNSLSMPAEEVQALIDAGNQYVVRFKIEPGRDVEVHDMLRGLVTIKSDILDDKVLYKSADDLPTYHLANIVDDHLMKISHVIRGEEWLPSAPLHVLLYEAFGWADTAPEFVHLPLLLKPDGKGKLSKRDGNKMGFPVFPMEFTDPATGEKWHGYKEDGYFPEAFINMLALLGWNPGTEQEIFTLEELAQLFSLEHVNKSGARFNPDKAKWFNHKYLIAKPDAELADLIAPYLQADGLAYDKPKVERICALMKERYNFVSELYEDCRFFFIAPTEYVEKDAKKYWKDDAPALMRELTELLKSIDDYSFANTEKIISAWITEKELGFGKVMNPFRVAIIGAAKGPHMFDVMEIIGKEETIRRMEKALEAMKN